MLGLRYVPPLGKLAKKNVYFAEYAKCNHSIKCFWRIQINKIYIAELNIEFRCSLIKKKKQIYNSVYVAKET